jgi:hypothetical protein
MRKGNYENKMGGIIMRMLTVLSILLLAILYISGACADETAEIADKKFNEMSEEEKKTSEIGKGLDEVEILNIEEEIIESQANLKNVNKIINEQLGRMEADVNSGDYVPGNYLSPLEAVALKFLKHYDRAFTENTPGKAQRIKYRSLKSDGELAARAQKVLDDLNQLGMEINKYKSCMNEEGALVLNDSIFESVRMDKINLTIVENNIEDALNKLDSVERIIDMQFEKMMNDIISGTYDEEAYFMALEGSMLDILEFNEEKFASATLEKVRKILDKDANSENGDRAQAALGEILQIEIEIEKYTPYWNKEEGMVLTTDIFKSRTGRFVSKILKKPKFLEDMIHLEENKLEFFLAGPAEKMWPKIKKGKKPFCVSSYKMALRDALIMIRDGKTYDVEKDLRKASKRFKKKDTIKLLYAYVLLINWENKNTLKKGYEFLKDAYDNLETEKLAYNMVRVGLRLEELQEDRLQKIIAHVQHKGDLKVLGELNDVRTYMYIEKDEYDKAYDYFINELRERQKGVWKHVSPVFKFIVFLKQGEYRMIATDVAPYDTHYQVKTLYSEYYN